MKALEIKIDGECCCVAGHPKAFGFQCFLNAGVGGDGNFAVWGYLTPENRGTADHAQWVEETVSEGQTVSVRIIETDDVDSPSDIHPSTHVRNRAGELELCCSFCGTCQSEAKKLVAGVNGNICEKCTALAHDIMVEEGLAK